MDISCAPDGQCLAGVIAIDFRRTLAAYYLASSSCDKFLP
jgi:hypothetical protein